MNKRDAMDTLTIERQYYSLCYEAGLPWLPIPAVSKAGCAHPTQCARKCPGMQERNVLYH